MRRRKPDGYVDAFKSEVTAVCEPLFGFWKKIEDQEIKSGIESTLIEINRSMEKIEMFAKAQKQDVLNLVLELEATTTQLNRLINQFKERNQKDGVVLEIIQQYANGMLLDHARGLAIIRS